MDFNFQHEIAGNALTAGKGVDKESKGKSAVGH
jgi:hypothetical protein